MIAPPPAAISSIMNLVLPSFVRRLKWAGIAWFATAKTLDEARAAQAEGAHAIIAQGAEAGARAAEKRDIVSRMRDRALFCQPRPLDFAVNGPLHTSFQILVSGLAKIIGAEDKANNSGPAVDFNHLLLAALLPSFGDSILDDIPALVRELHEVVIRITHRINEQRPVY